LVIGPACSSDEAAQVIVSEGDYLKHEIREEKLSNCEIN
jgi:hypothetical protein